MRNPLEERYFVPVLFVILLGVGLTTAVSYYYTKRTVEEVALGQMSQALFFLEKAVSEKTSGVEGDAILWSREEVFRLALGSGYLARSARTAANSRLAERCRFNGYDRAFVALPNGDLAASSDQESMQFINVSDRAYFARSLRGEMVLETLPSGKVTGTPVLVLSAPVRDRDGPVLGVLAIVVDIESFSSGVLARVHLGASGGAFVMDAADKPLAAPPWKASGQFEPPPSALAALRSQAQPGPVRYFSGASERMAMAVIDKGTGWLIAVEADPAEILRPAERLAALNGAISLTVLALVGAALWLLRKAVASLRASEARYRVLTETTPVGIATFDAMGRADYTNQRALAILGLNGQQDQEQAWTGRFETRSGDAVAFEELPMAQAREGGRPVLGRTLWYRRPGEDTSRLILSLSAAPLPSQGGQPGGVVCVIEDVTERARIQDMMIQTEKMLSVGGLAAGMAHEINNPLASVLQAAQVIARRLDPSLPANASAAGELGLDLDSVRAYMEARGIYSFLRGIEEAGGRAARIVRNMLGFSRKSAGEYAQCDLAQLLDKTVELAGGDYDLKKQYDFKRIEILKEYDPGLAPVECQATEIEQVLFNIVKNAAQALSELPKEGPRPRIVLRTFSRRGMAVVEIEDNGPGMPEETRKRIFEPFYTTKAVGVGTGLGLSVAYFIINENHKGSISVESAPGRGALFRVSLPFSRIG